MCASSNSRRSEKGFFLVEVLLSVVILSVSLTLIIQSMTSALRSSAFAGDHTTALMILENKMFDLFEKGFVETGLKKEEQIPRPYDRYWYFLDVKPAGEKNERRLHEVDAVLTWKSGKRQNRVAFQTYLPGAS